jgi:hypothetical protein
MKHDEGLDRHARPYAARIDEPAIRLVVTEQERPKQRPCALRVRPPDNDELGAIEAFAFNPGAAIAGQIRAIEPLRDDAFKAMLARRPAKGFAIAVLVVAIGNSCWRLLEKRS